MNFFARFGADLYYAQSMLSNKISASELSRKFIKSALLVGISLSLSLSFPDLKWNHQFFFSFFPFPSVMFPLSSSLTYADWNVRACHAREVKKNAKHVNKTT